MSPTAKSLILDLLSTVRRGSMPVRALVTAGALFDIADNAIRVALARLLAEGRVERDERGRYRLGAGAEAIQRQVAGWRRVPDQLVAWRGGWVAAHGVPPPATGGGRGQRGEARRAWTALRLLGFAELEPGVALRPDNLVGGIEALRRQLAGLGSSNDTWLCALSQLDSEHELRARSLWDAAALVDGYREAARELERSAERLRRLPVAEGMVESFLVGGQILRQIVLDPRLPEPIVPRGALQELVDRMVEYDRLGRSCWADFMRRDDVPHLRHPVDWRIAERPWPAAAAGETR